MTRVMLILALFSVSSIYTPAQDAKELPPLPTDVKVTILQLELQQAKLQRQLQDIVNQFNQLTQQIAQASHDALVSMKLDAEKYYVDPNTLKVAQVPAQAAPATPAPPAPPTDKDK